MPRQGVADGVLRRVGFNDLAGRSLATGAACLGERLAAFIGGAIIDEPMEWWSWGLEFAPRSGRDLGSTRSAPRWMEGPI